MIDNNSKIVRLDGSAVDAILDLWKRSGLLYKPGGRDDRVRLEQMINRGTETFFGIYSEGELVSVVLVTHDGRKGWINRLAVDPAHRRRGIAKCLIHYAEEHLHKEGIEIIAALIEDWNKESLNLFQSCGYVLHEDIRYLTKRDRPDV